MAEFPMDHPIECLRGRTMPELEKIRQELAVRIQWLKHTIELQKLRGRLPGRELPELKAMVMLKAMHDQAYPPESDTDRPPAPTGDES